MNRVPHQDRARNQTRASKLIIAAKVGLGLLQSYLRDMGNEVSRTVASQSPGGRKIRINIDSTYAEAYQVGA